MARWRSIENFLGTQIPRKKGPVGKTPESSSWGKVGKEVTSGKKTRRGKLNVPS